ncbi:hypothetical protein BC834DRAFT_1033153, partial [Gloeopeniophorella convolvens]
MSPVSNEGRLKVERLKTGLRMGGPINGSMSATVASGASGYQQLFTEVLKEYKKRTGKDPTGHALVAQLRDCVSPDDVTALLRKQAEEIDEAHRASWRGQLSERIAPIARVIRPLCDAAGKAAGLGFKPGEAIFGGIGIILAVPENHVKNHRALLQWFEQMGRCLRRLEILIVPGDVLFDDTMTEIVVGILMELIRILAILSQKIGIIDGWIPKAKRRFKKGIAALSGDDDIGNALRKLDRLTKEENLMVTALASRDIAIVKREQERQERMQQAGRYRTWLSVPNCSTNQVIASEARHSDTSMWLVRGDLYEAWRRGGALLWITGKPGAGKTVHCSTVINDLESLLRCGGSQAALAYFYCDFRDTQKQSYRSLLSSLLVDLSTQSDASDNMLRELYSKHGDGSRDPTDDDLAQCLKGMLRQSGGTQYIVVDALDEMPNYGLSSSRRKTLGLVKDLIDLGLP